MAALPQHLHQLIEEYMSKSKRIKQLEIEVEALRMLADALIITVSGLIEDNEKRDIQAGKWYK